MCVCLFDTTTYRRALGLVEDMNHGGPRGHDKWGEEDEKHEGQVEGLQDRELKKDRIYALISV